MDESGFITAYGSGGGNSFAGVVAYVIGILDQLVLVLIALAFLLFMWAVFQYIYGAARGKHKNRQSITWGLLTLFILVSIWGILRLACDSFLGVGLCSNSAGTPTSITPASYQGGSPTSAGTPGGTGGLY